MFSLRPRTFADCEEMTRWVPDADSLYLFTGPRLNWPLTSGQLSAMELTGLSAWMLVEEGDETPLGHFDLVLEGQIVRIGRVIIAPAHRRRGLAHVLINLAIDQAKQLGASEMLLNVISGNEPAIRVYERAGFTELPYSDRPNVTVMHLPLR